LQSKAEVQKTRFEEESWEGVNHDLFDSLRILRRKIADERNVPAYVLFSDATLRDMARVRPGSPTALLGIRGIGERKLADLGQRFLELIATHCRTKGLPLDVTMSSRPHRQRTRDLNDTKETAFGLFAKGASVEQVAAKAGRVVSTTWGYLAEFIQIHRPERLDPWIEPKTYRAVADAVKTSGTAYLRPIFDQLDGKVPYEQIRAVVAHLKTMRETRTE
jgi:ATP-dependent DNA helicase RecQ